MPAPVSPAPVSPSAVSPTAVSPAPVSPSGPPPRAPQVTCTRKLGFDAMHRIPRHESKCAAFHGHRYTAEITCQAAALDDRGRVVDFGVIKERVGGWIDARWDHTAILMRDDPDPAAQAIAASNADRGRPVYWLDAPPTAENIAIELARVAQELLADTGVEVVAVRLWETPNAFADWRA